MRTGSRVEPEQSFQTISSISQHSSHRLVFFDAFHGFLPEIQVISLCRTAMAINQLADVCLRTAMLAQFLECSSSNCMELQIVVESVVPNQIPVAGEAFELPSTSLHRGHSSVKRDKLTMKYFSNCPRE